MRRGGFFVFLVIYTVLVVAIVLAAVGVFNNQGGEPDPAQQVVITVPILITWTSDPNATEVVRVVTATPQAGTPQVVALPTGLIDTTPGAPGDGGAGAAVALNAPTIDPAVLEGNPDLQSTADALPAGCILHTIKEGDTPFAIAEQYEADGFELLAVNGLDEAAATFLQIGDTLIVPLEGCELTAVILEETETAALVTPSPSITPSPTGPTSTASPSPTLSPTPSNTPTSTLPPTATNAQVEITRVLGAGDINAEGVEIRNNGAVVDLSGWTLSDGGDNVYTFPQQRLFQGGLLTVYTRVGTDTPSAKYWGRDEAVWRSGATLTLRDASDRVQSVFVIP